MPRLLAFLRSGRWPLPTMLTLLTRFSARPALRSLAAPRAALTPLLSFGARSMGELSVAIRPADSFGGKHNLKILVLGGAVALYGSS